MRLEIGGGGSGETGDHQVLMAQQVLARPGGEGWHVRDPPEDKRTTCVRVRCVCVCVQYEFDAADAKGRNQTSKSPLCVIV